MWHDNETDIDLLGFNVHVDLIKQIILDHKMHPTSIGVFGDWGSGKSSIIKILLKELKEEKEKKIVSLYFNGWAFEGYDDAKAALIEAILKQLKKNETIAAEGKNAIKKLLKKVDWMRAGQFAFKNVAMPFYKAYSTGGISLLGNLAHKFFETISNSEELKTKMESEEGKEMTKEFKNFIKKTKETEKINIPKAVRDFREKFEKAIEETKIDCLVVFVDDLDRCSPDRIIDNLEAIKLFLNVKKTVFIIGADRRIVRNAVQHRYKAKDLRDTEIDEYEQLVTDYLEKLIQIPYFLPQLSDTEVETYLTLLICQRDLTPDEFNKIVTKFVEFRKTDRYSTFGYGAILEIINEHEKIKKLTIIPHLSPLITEGLKGNPRQIKRFLNAFSLRSRFANVANIDNFNDEILIKLMILEYIENGDRFKDLYRRQVNDKGFPMLISELENKNEDFDQTIETSYKDWDKPNLKAWLKMEPQLSGIDLSDYFWISRDKLSINVKSSSLVAPIVRSLYKLIIDSPSETNITKEIKNLKVKLISEENIHNFIRMVMEGILKDPSKKNGHQIAIDMLIEHSLGKNEYLKTLERIPKKDFTTIPPSVGNKLKLIKDKTIMDEIKTIIARNPDSKISKALN